MSYVLQYFCTVNKLNWNLFPPNQVLLNHSASLLSHPCQPHWCLNHLKPLSFSKRLLDIPVFVQQGRPAEWALGPPLGLHGSEEHLALTLASMPEPGLPPSLKTKDSCRRCVVVGNGGVLQGSHLGPHIDQYDVIIRYSIKHKKKKIYNIRWVRLTQKNCEEVQLLIKQNHCFT